MNSSKKNIIALAIAIVMFIWGVLFTGMFLVIDKATSNVAGPIEPYIKVDESINVAGPIEPYIKVDESIDKVIFIRDSFGNWKPHYYINDVETIAERLTELDYE